MNNSVTTDFNEVASNFVSSEDSNLLAIRKSMETNAGYMYSAASKSPADIAPLIVNEATVLGVQSQYGLTKPTKDEKELEKQKRSVTNGNPQRVDQAFLPMEHDLLIYKFTARANGTKGLPIENCSSQSLTQHLINIAEHYSKAGGYEYLGTLMAANIADAQFAFRNRAAESIETTVTVKEASKMSDSTYKPAVFQFQKLAGEDPCLNVSDSSNPVSDPDVQALGKLIGKGFAGEDLILIDVESKLKVGFGQEVYPSQEMVDDSSPTASSRVYYKDNETGQAKVHAQKIGNGVRKIDIWHPEVSKYGALPAEAYGNYARRATAVRLQDNFYSAILKPEFKSLSKKVETPFYDALSKASSLKDLHSIENLHFFMAILMRGGVFGMK